MRDVTVNILIVSTDKSHYNDLAYLLDHNTYTFYYANSTKKAIQLEKEHGFSLLLIADNLAGEATALISTIRKSTNSFSEAPILFISKRKEVVTPNDIPEQYDLGRLYFPFDKKVIIEKLSYFIDQPQLNQLDHYKSRIHELSNELENLTYSLSHDLKAPLRAVWGFSDLLLKDQDINNTEKEKYLNFIISNVNKSNAMMNAVMEFSTLLSSRLNASEFELKPLVVSTFHEIHRRLGSTQVKFTVHQLPEKLEADVKMIQKLIKELMTNAMHFALQANEPEITFGMETSEEGEAIFYVQDNGIGFNTNHSEKLFTLFGQLHPRQQLDEKSMGTGLAFAKKIVERHNGQIWAKSEPNKGSVFYFTLNDLTATDLI